MSQHTIDELREYLFTALKGLSDKEAPLDIERARAIADVAQTVINSAKVEVEHMRLAGGAGSGFLPSGLSDSSTPRLTQNGVQQSGTTPDGSRVTRHRMR